MKMLKIVSLGLGVMMLMSGCSSQATGQEKGQEKEPITVILDYIPNTNHTGMYVALEEGYYEEVGLDVKIIEPTEGATPTLVAVGKGDFGISYQEDVTLAKAAKDPLPIKAIAALIQNNTSGFVSYQEKGITSVEDFEGKIYAGWGGAGEEAVLRAVMDQAGVAYDSLERVISDGSGFSALKDRVDLMWFYEAWDNIVCQLNDFPINYIPLRELDERLNFYTPVVITNEKMITERPETVRKFLEATEKGYEYAMSNPEESAAVLHQYAPDYSLEMLTESQKYLAGEYKKGSPSWGLMEESRWANYTEFLLEYGVISQDVAPSECYTNAFLKGQE